MQEDGTANGDKILIQKHNYGSIYVDVSSMVGLFLLVCLSQAPAKLDNVGRTSIPVLLCKGSCQY